MESRELVPYKSHPHHTSLRRSQSAQPEKSTLSSSPYSTKKKLKYPGRSLTEIFTDRHDRSERAHSDEEGRRLHRRKTVASTPSGLSQLVPIREASSNWVSSDVTPVESDYGQLSNLPVYKMPALNDASETYGNSNQTNSVEVYRRPYSRSKRGLSELKTDIVGSRGSPTRTKIRSIGGRDGNKVKKSNVAEWKLLKLILKFSCWLVISVLLVLLLIIGTGILLAYLDAICQQKKNAILPLSDLKLKLTQTVIGQEIAIDMILRSLSGVQPGHVGMPLIMWMVGGTGIGKTLTAHILKDVLANVFPVHVLVASLLPSDDDDLENEITSLFHKLDSCSLSLIIIDDWDDQSNTPVKALKNILDNFQDYRTLGYEKGQVVIILSGTRGSQEIASRYTELRQRGKARTELRFENFNVLSTSIQEAELLSAVTKHYVFVPFLPLEASHIELCVRNELLKLLNADIVMQEEDLQKISQQVLNQLNFVPASYPLLVATGCKRVQPLLSHVLPGFTLSQTSS